MESFVISSSFPRIPPKTATVFGASVRRLLFPGPFFGTRTLDSLRFGAFLGRQKLRSLGPISACPSFPTTFYVRCSIKECPKAAPGVDAPSELSGGEALIAFSPKVASAGLVVLLSTTVLILLQPILAQPASAALHSSIAKHGGLARTQLFSSACTGFFAGCLHTLSGPDHLAALAPLCIGKTRVESAIAGALWGCGHDAGQVMFGLLFLLLKDRLHIELFRSWGTIVVGLTLLLIGAMGIKDVSEVPITCVAVGNGEFDVSLRKPLEAAPTGKSRFAFATFATGIVHGLQPDALLILLPAVALPSRVAAAAFLSMFLVGTVFAMGSYTLFLGSCTQALKDRVPRITEKLTWASSVLAVCMGLGIIIGQALGFSLY